MLRCFLLIAVSLPAWAQDRSEAIAEARAWLEAQQRADGRLAGPLDLAGTARLAMAVEAAGGDAGPLKLSLLRYAREEALGLALAVEATGDPELERRLRACGPDGDFGNRYATAQAARVLADGVAGARLRDEPLTEPRFTASALRAFLALDWPVDAARARTALEGMQAPGGGFGRATAEAALALAEVGAPSDALVKALRALERSEARPQIRAALYLAGARLGDAELSRAGLSFARSVDPGGLFDESRSLRDTAAFAEAIEGAEGLAAWLWISSRPADALSTTDLALQQLATLRASRVPDPAPLLARRHSSGAFALRPGGRPDPLTTLRASTALALMGLEDPRAVDWLLSAGFALGRQGGDAGFVAARGLALLPDREAFVALRGAAEAALDAPETALELAAALEAEPGRDPAALLALQAEDGSWSGSNYVTARALVALDAGRADLSLRGALEVEPGRPAPNQDALLRIEVSNLGFDRAPPTEVHVTVDGELAAEAPLEGLEPEATRVLEIPWRTPDVEGPVELCARLDAEGAVRERDELDNLACRTIDLGARPDLAVTPADLTTRPVALFEGQPLTLDVRVHDLLGVPARAEVALSLDGAPLQGFEDIPFRPYGDTRLSLDLPGGLLAGPHRLCVQIDPTDAVEEADETNNTACLPVTVLGAPGFDAAVGTLEALPTRGAPGSTTRLTATVHNAGSQAWEQLEVAFAVTSPAGETSAVGLGRTPRMVSGERRSVTVDWVAPAAPGDYRWSVHLDPTNRLAEASEENNQASAILPIRARDAIDLVLADAAPLAPPLAGQPFTLGVEVRNHGGRASEGAELRLSRGLEVLAEGFTERLPALGASTTELRLTLPAGRHRLRASVDAAGLIEEASEANNAFDFEVQVASGAGPDLALLGLETVPTPAQAGEVGLALRVANLGGAAAGPFTVQISEDNTRLDAGALPGLESGAEARTFLTAELARGVHALLVEADPEARVADGGRGNNTKLFRVAVVGGDLPAPTLEGLEVSPAPPVAGDLVALRVRAWNLGRDPAEGFTLRFSLDGEVLGEETVDLAGGTGETVEHFTRLPVGPHTLCVNALCLEIDVRPPVDLSFAEVAVEPASPLLGQPAELVAEVVNTGTAAAPAGALVEVWLGEARVAGAELPELLEGATHALRLPWAAPEPAGRGMLRFVVDVAEQLEERREDNNEAQLPVRILVPGQPELAAALEWAPERPRAGAEVTLTATVENLGDGPARQFRLHLGVDALEESFLVPALAPGETRTEVAVWSPPAAGDFEVVLEADRERVLEEVDREDNRVVATITAHNAAPRLAWVRDAPAYARRGFAPIHGGVGTDFEFRVMYLDPEGDPPRAPPRLELDFDGDGLADEQLVTEAEDPEDLDYTDGRVFGLARALPEGRALRYRFAAEDPLGEGAIHLGLQEPAFGPTEWQPGPWVLAAPHVRVMPTYRSWVGRGPVRVWAEIWSPPESLVSWRWDFGDGHFEEGALEAPRLERQHDYPAIGTYRARLTATDALGRQHSAETTVIVGDPTDALRRDSARLDALRALYMLQRPDGSWPRQGPAGAEAGAALLAWHNNQHFEAEDYEGDPLAVAAQRAMDSLLFDAIAAASELPFDGNGNGRSVSWARNNYVTPIALLGLLSTLEPERYAGLVQDVTDYLLWAQGGLGGWRYTGRDPSADNSVSSWSFLALGEAALCPFYVEVPASTWTRGLAWLDATHAAEGNFRYGSNTQTGLMTATAAGLIGLWATGGGEARLSRTLEWTATNFDPAEFDNLYLSYTLARAFRLHGLADLDGRDWLGSMQAAAIARQTEEGSAQGADWVTTAPLGTAFLALTLTDAIIGPRPIAKAGPDRSVFPEQEVCFDGGLSTHPDPRRVITHWSWDLDGDGLDDAEGPEVCARFEEGVHRVRLRVRDDAPCPQSDEVSVQVVATLGNHPPEARITAPEVVFLDAEVVLDAEESEDPDGDALSYAWDALGSGVFEAGEAQLALNLRRPGTTHVGLRVCDPEGLCGETRAAIQVVELSLGAADAHPALLSPTASPGVQDAALVRVTASREGQVDLVLLTDEGIVGRVAGGAGPDHLLRWAGRGLDGEALPSGRYTYRLQASGSPHDPSAADWETEPAPLRPAPATSATEVRAADGGRSLYYAQEGAIWRAALIEGVWVPDAEPVIGAGSLLPEAPEDLAGASDPSALTLPGGALRIYYTGAAEEGALSVLSATSEDGILFSRDAGVRVAGSAPSVVSGAGVDLYFVVGDEIQVASSEDGLEFGEASLVLEGSAPEALHDADGLRLFLVREGRVHGWRPGGEPEPLFAGQAPSANHLEDGGLSLIYADAQGLRRATHHPGGLLEIDDQPPTAELAELAPVDLASGRVVIRGAVSDEDFAGEARNFAGYRVWVTPPGGEATLIGEGAEPVDGALAVLEAEDAPPGGLSGPWLVEVEARDRAGNTTRVRQESTIFRSALPAPSIDLPTEPGQPIFVTAPRVPIAGRADPLSIVEVWRGAELLGRAEADRQARWALPSVELEPGVNRLHASALREALSSPASEPIEVTRDVVEARVSLPAALDRGQDVQIRAEVDTLLPSREARLSILTAAGRSVAELARFTTDRPSRDIEWNVGDLEAGQYLALLEVRQSGEVVASASAPFEVRPEASLIASLQSDRAVYGAGDEVLLEGAVRAEGNAPSLGVEASVLVEGAPLGVFALGDLLPGAAAPVAARWAVAGRPAGDYEAELTAPGAAPAVARFTVRSTAEDGGGLTGVLDPATYVAEPETPVPLTVRLGNQGNADFEGALRVELVGPEGTTEVETWLVELPIAGEAERVVDLSAPAGDYTLRLVVITPSGERELDRVDWRAQPFDPAGTLELLLPRRGVGLLRGPTAAANLALLEQASALAGLDFAAHGESEGFAAALPEAAFAVLLDASAAHEVLADAARQGLPLLSLHSSLGEADAEVFGARILGAGAGSGRLVPTGALAFAAVSTGGDALTLAPDTAEVWARLEGDREGAPVEALVMPVAGTLELRVEAVAEDAPQWATATIGEQSAAIGAGALVAGTRLRLEVRAGDRVELRLGVDLRGLGGAIVDAPPTLLGLDEGWAAEYSPVPGVEARTRLSLRLLGAPEAPALVALERSVLSAVDPGAGPPAGWAQALRVLLEAIVPSAARPSAARPVRLELRLPGGPSVRGEARLRVPGEVIEAEGAVADGDWLVFGDLDLGQARTLSLRARLQEGPQRLEAEVRRLDPPGDWASVATVDVEVGR